MNVNLYFLLDEKGIVRYVGKTQKPLCERLAAHIYEAKNSKKRNHRLNWIKSMLDSGKRPTIELKYKLNSHESANVEEVYWIKFLKQMGCNLTNGTKGGEGCPCTPETREKISKAAVQRYKDRPELREFAKEHAKNTIANYVRKPGEFFHSQESKDKIGASQAKKPVRSIDIKTGEVKEYKSYTEASRDVCSTRTSGIAHALKGRAKTAYGKKWEYING